MKKILLAVFSLISIISYSQTTGYFRYDTVRLEKPGGNTTLIVKNSTSNIANGFLQNYAEGRTRFARALDSVWIDGDSIRFRYGLSTLAVLAPASSGGVDTSVFASREWVDSNYSNWGLQQYKVIAPSDTTSGSENLRNDQGATYVMPNGDYVTLYNRFGASSGDLTASYIYITRSTDRGRTWSTGQPLIGDGIEAHQGASVHVQEDGGVVVIYQRKTSVWFVEKRLSTDNLLTVGSATIIYGPTDKKTSLAPDRILKLHTGDLVYPVSERTVAAGESSNVKILKSTDDGDTWSNVGVTITVADSSIQEPGMVEYKDVMTGEYRVDLYWRSDRTLKAQYKQTTDLSGFTGFSAEKDFHFWNVTATITVKYDSINDVFWRASNRMMPPPAPDSTGANTFDRGFLDLYATPRQWGYESWHQVMTLDYDTINRQHAFFEPSIFLDRDRIGFVYSKYICHPVVCGGTYRYDMIWKSVPVSSVIPKTDMADVSYLRVTGRKKKQKDTGGSGLTYRDLAYFGQNATRPWLGGLNISNNHDIGNDDYLDVPSLYFNEYGSTRPFIISFDRSNHSTSFPFARIQFSANEIGTGINANRPLLDFTMLSASEPILTMFQNRVVMSQRLEHDVRTTAQAGTYGSLADGQVYYNSDSARLMLRSGGAWKGLKFTSEGGSGGGSGDALTTNPLSQFAATTSAQLAGVVSDETGTDKLVYNTSPLFVTPRLAATSTISHVWTATDGSGNGSWQALPGGGGSQTPWTSNINADGFTLFGNDGSGQSLTLGSTSHATKGTIILGTSIYDEVNNRLGIGGTPSKSLDIWDGELTVKLGGDQGLKTRTDNIAKYSRITSAHYDNEDDPISVFYGESTSSTNNLTIGGGSSSTNAMTNINFNTGTGNSTASGTERMSIGASVLVINELGNNYDTRIEGDNSVFMFFLDASADAIGIANNAPTAYLHIGAGTATAGDAPLKFTSGTNLTTPENGAFEYDGTSFFFTTGGTRQTFASLAGTETFTNKTLSTSTSVSAAISFSDGVKQTFNPDGTNAGINVGDHTANPSSLVNGDLWYNSTSNELNARINGATVALGAGGGGGANTALSNLASVAINTSLISDADNTDDLGSTSITWKDIFTRTTKFRSASAGTATLQFLGAGTPTIGLPNNTGTLVARSISGEASNATPTPLGDGAMNFYELTALATNATFAAPSGTAPSHALLWVVIKDNGTARTLGWNAIYDAGSDLALPTTTVAGEGMELQFRWHEGNSTWRLTGRIGGF